MVKPIFRPIRLAYSGLYADDHRLDLQELGVSLQGYARVANSITNFYFTGEVARDSRAFQMRTFAGPPKAGSLYFDTDAILIAGSIPLWSPVVYKFAEKVIPKLASAIIELATGRKDKVDRIVASITEMANQHTDFAKQVHEGHMRDKVWMQNHIDKLANHNSAPLKELVAPVGTSCRLIQIGDGSSEEEAGLIDEAKAQVIRSKEPVKVGQSIKFTGVFEGVDTTNGICKFRVQGEDEARRGKITDPALAAVGNVYTHSLDTGRAVIVDAKPIIKDGEITQLFISDGRFEDER